VKEEKDFPEFSISEIEKGIALIKHKGVEMDLQAMIRVYDEIEKIGKGKRIAILNSFDSYIPPDKEAMKYMASKRPPKLIYASAILVESLAIQVVVMMFMRFNKQKVPRKVFNCRRKVLEWLREMKKKEKKFRLTLAPSKFFPASHR
jgi:hypothetical protein